MASLIEALIPADQAADAGARKIGPDCQYLRRKVARRIVLFAFAIGKLGKQLGFFERLLTDGLAFRPQGAELGHILLNGAVDALLIESQKLEICALGEPSLSLGEGFVNGNLSGVFSDSPAGWPS